MIDATPEKQEVPEGRGYVSYSKSRNAYDACQRGAFNATELSEILKIPGAWIKETFTTDEWHHCSGFFNRVEYYDRDIVAKYASSCEGKRALRAWKKARKAEHCLGWCQVEWTEFIGPRRRRKAVQRVACAIVTVKGSYAYFEADGVPMKKLLDGKHFKILHGPKKRSGKIYWQWDEIEACPPEHKA